VHFVDLRMGTPSYLNRIHHTPPRLKTDTLPLLWV
jgi:hypothetical protein